MAQELTVSSKGHENISETGLLPLQQFRALEAGGALPNGGCALSPGYLFTVTRQTCWRCFYIFENDCISCNLLLKKLL